MRIFVSIVVLAVIAFPPSRPEAVAQEDSQSALQVIESNRGGRHWVDEATAPPRTPSESLAAIEIEPGYEIELFAAEPLVRDPVAICFDRRGRMFVVEYSDYPIGPPDGDPPLSKVVLLEDRDNDGVADSRTVFADRLDFAHSLMAYKGGILVGAKTEVLFLKDADEDGVAEIRETLFDGFTPAHPQMQIGNPRWGLDNWVYLNYGPGEVTRVGGDDEARTLPRKDFRFSPRSMRFESDSGLGQYGNTIDRWGNRFYCTNRNPIITTLLSPDQLARNPFHVVTRPYYDVAPSGGDSRVYPLVAMKSNYLSHAGTHTSACGTTAYLGELGDASFRDSVFVCEPIGHLVTRTIVQSDRVPFSARRARDDHDFVASTDTWFRPSSLATGPDGALYLADMYRLWVEHPKFLPEEIAAKLDWRAGEDRGRIYRIVPSGESTRPFDPPQSDQQIVALLEDANAWRQFLGQRLLVEQQRASVVPPVRALIHHPAATTRLHALWTLDGLSRLKPDDVLALCRDADPNCRESAVRLAEPFLDDAEMLHAVIDLADDPSQRVRFRVALSLSASPSPEATDALVRLALSDGRDRTFADGLLTAVKERAGQILERIVGEDEFVSDPDSDAIHLVDRLATIVGARGDQEELRSLFELIGQQQESRWWQSTVVAGIGNGLPRYRGDLGRLTLAKLSANPPTAMAASVKSLDSVFERGEMVATNPRQDLFDRVAAVELLAHRPIERVSETFQELLSNHQPAEIQTACLDALQRNGSAVAAEMVLDRWDQLSPRVRGSAIEFLLRRQESTRMTLQAMADGIMRPAMLGIDQRVRLLKHTDDQIRTLASKLFGGVVSENRKQVAKDYERSLSLAADFDNGKKVFSRVCANCHRIDGAGHNTGPDLSDVRNRSKPALLYDILDPNSKVEPRFTAYTVLTADGAVFTGLVESESSDAVVLKMAEGKTKTIGRAEVEQMKASEVSLMPEGVEKDITVEEMADLLAYLKDR